MRGLLYSVLILGFLCLTTTTFAQKEQENKPTGWEKKVEKLGLTEDQRNQIRQILENQRIKLQPLRRELREIHRQIKEIGRDGIFNEALASQLATREAEINKQIRIEHLRTKASIFALLTPEQRTKLAQMDFGKNRFRREKFRTFRYSVEPRNP